MADVSILLLYDSDKRVYLQHRSDYKERWAGYWGTFGGSIEEGETISQALEREIQEELAYQVANPILIHTQNLGRDKKYVHVELYDTSQKLIPSKKECKDAQWVTREEALKLNLIPHEIKVLEEAFRFLNGE